MRRRMSAIGLAVAAVLGGVALAGGSQQEAPKIEPKADQYLKAMSSYLAGLKTYSFQVEEFFDEVQDDGQKTSAQQPAPSTREPARQSVR